VYGWVNLGGALLAHLLALRWIERRGWEPVGLGRAALRPRLLGRGAALGALAIGLPSLLLLAVGALRAEPTRDGSWWGTALSTLGVLAPARCSRSCSCAAIRSSCCARPRDRGSRSR
jgi:hypothetical protein